MKNGIHLLEQKNDHHDYSLLQYCCSKDPSYFMILVTSRGLVYSNLCFFDDTYCRLTSKKYVQILTRIALVASASVSSQAQRRNNAPATPTRLAKSHVWFNNFTIYLDVLAIFSQIASSKGSFTYDVITKEGRGVFK